ncbi:hypothetical protein DdX_02695 [Ditylenchus destructor]|uniref:Uncharacterized protein n=1 Tax=Ditylenchus destructor TaxID=166010 RepID=A0AAD4RCF8_9BILA|nr:hypothetical protein DdX_02695 [Ditylenchus destructor]
MQKTNITSRIIFITLIGLVSGNIQIALKDSRSDKFCAILQASNITGAVEYYNTYRQEPMFYNFTVDPLSISSSGTCHMKNPNASLLILWFLPNEMKSKDATMEPSSPKLWSLRMYFNVKTPNEFVMDYYTLVAYFDSRFNASTDLHVYEPITKSKIIKSHASGYGFNCSNTMLQLGSEAHITLVNLKIVANAALSNETLRGIEFDRCFSDTLVDNAISWGLIAFVGFIILLFLFMLIRAIYYVREIHRVDDRVTLIIE